MSKSPNFPATLRDIDNLDTAMPHIAGGRPMETIGQSLTRLIDKMPAPLPDELARQVAVTIAADPAEWGRLFAHCIEAACAEEVEHE